MEKGCCVSRALRANSQPPHDWRTQANALPVALLRCSRPVALGIGATGRGSRRASDRRGKAAEDEGACASADAAIAGAHCSAAVLNLTQSKSVACIRGNGVLRRAFASLKSRAHAAWTFLRLLTQGSPA